jgi:hypothetical protein
MPIHEESMTRMQPSSKRYILAKNTCRRDAVPLFCPTPAKWQVLDCAALAAFSSPKRITRVLRDRVGNRRATPTRDRNNLKCVCKPDARAQLLCMLSIAAHSAGDASLWIMLVHGRCSQKGVMHRARCLTGRIAPNKPPTDPHTSTIPEKGKSNLAQTHETLAIALSHRKLSTDMTLGSAPAGDTKETKKNTVLVGSASLHWTAYRKGRLLRENAPVNAQLQGATSDSCEAGKALRTSELRAPLEYSSGATMARHAGSSQHDTNLLARTGYFHQ